MKQKNSGIVLHGATVALTPARAVTSHLRKRYREKYLGRRRFPRLAFAFDLSILGVVIALISWGIYFVTSVPVPPPSLGVIFSTGPIITAAPQALEAKVQARSGDSSGPVRLTWHLPPNTEILSADPPLDNSGTVYLGRIAAGKETVSRLVVRLYSGPGSLRFAFQVSDGNQTFDGGESRPVNGSGLLLEPLFDSVVALADGRIPMRLSNRTDRRLETISLTGLDRSLVEQLEPDQDIVLFTTAARVSASMRAIPLVDREVVPVSLASGPSVHLDPSSGNDAHLSVDTSSPGKVFVYHPGLVHPHVKSFDVPAGHTALTVKLDRPADEQAWYAVAQNEIGYGQVAASVVTTPFDISASARYYASSGDQIGIGPLPPQVGQTTKYWVQIKLAPTRADLNAIKVSVKLGPHVVPTGRDALLSGGQWTQAADASNIWTLDYLAASGEGAEADLEVALTPTNDDRSKPAILVDSVQATATEIKSGLKLQSQFGSIDTTLPGDTEAAGKSIIE